MTFIAPLSDFGLDLVFPESDVINSVTIWPNNWVFQITELNTTETKRASELETNNKTKQKKPVDDEFL